jgi:hypothetical protein
MNTAVAALEESISNINTFKEFTIITDSLSNKNHCFIMHKIRGRLKTYEHTLIQDEHFDLMWPVTMIFMCGVKAHMVGCSCSGSCSCSPSSDPPSWKKDVCTPAAAMTQIPPRILPFLSTVHSLSVT